MKGLFIKDFSYIKESKLLFLILVLFGFGSSYFYKKPTFVLGYFSVFPGIILMSTISYDSINHGFTSLFTTKGYFPKAVFGGYIYKLKKDSVLEYPAYLIGKQIGVNVAEVALDGEYVKIKIFTDYSTSLVHASELKTYFDTSDEIYNILINDDKYRDIINQLQRMYIFNYIIANPDLHDDNYGLLYNSETFEFKSVSPCYDHNVAFQEGLLGLSRTTMGNSASIPLDDLCEHFIVNYKDIAQKLKSIDLDEVKAYLSERQFNELNERITNVISWSE